MYAVIYLQETGERGLAAVTDKYYVATAKRESLESLGYETWIEEQD